MRRLPSRLSGHLDDLFINGWELTKAGWTVPHVSEMSRAFGLAYTIPHIPGRYRLRFPTGPEWVVEKHPRN
jgi:hypothetical protein